MNSNMDKLFQVKTLSKMPDPQRVVYAAMHQDYSENFVFEELFSQEEFNPDLSEEECGDRIIKHLLAGNRGHFGPLEHPQIVFNIGYFPHSTMQQMRTHRVGISFDVQSFRYTGQRIIDVVDPSVSIHDYPFRVDKVFYLRPSGTYTDRQGKRYEYSDQERKKDLNWCVDACLRYREKIELGFSEEHARGLIPFDIRQHWVMSCNIRTLMHVLDMRWKADAQLECQQLCDLIWPHFESWVPAIAGWYKANRAHKARLAP